MSATFYGFDVSQWNGAVDMAKAKKNGKDFVIIRSSYGNVAAYPKQTDYKFTENVKKAKAAGLAFGVYHYCYATTISAAQAEARGFVKLLDSVKPIPYFVALDIEDTVQSRLSGATLQAIIKAFIDIVETAGYFCALYSYESFLSRLSVTFRNRYAIWCANINRKPSIAYGVHQYSFTGTVSGVSGSVDLNRTAVDYPTKIKVAGLNGYPKNTVKTLDSAGFKKGDKGVGVLALKKLLVLSGASGLDSSSGFGGGTEKAVNALLKKWGYKQNGIVGDKFINKLYKEAKK